MTPSNSQTSFPKWPFPRRTPPASLRRWAAGAFLLAVLSLFLAFMLEGDPAPQLPEYSIGDIARADVVVPNNLVFKDEPASESARASAAEKVLPVYRYSPEKNMERATTLAKSLRTVQNAVAGLSRGQAQACPLQRITRSATSCVVRKVNGHRR